MALVHSFRTTTCTHAHYITCTSHDPHHSDHSPCHHHGNDHGPDRDPSNLELLWTSRRNTHYCLFYNRLYCTCYCACYCTALVQERVWSCSDRNNLHTVHWSHLNEVSHGQVNVLYGHANEVMGTSYMYTSYLYIYIYKLPIYIFFDSMCSK